MLYVPKAQGSLPRGTQYWCAYQPRGVPYVPCTVAPQERTRVIWEAVVKAGIDRQCERLGAREATREEALSCHR